MFRGHFFKSYLWVPELLEDGRELVFIRILSGCQLLELAEAEMLAFPVHTLKATTQ
jgi:hypothetical protein